MSHAKKGACFWSDCTRTTRFHATVQSTPIALASVIANPTTSMTVVSLLRISDKIPCDFPPGLSGI
jgi:hypothetical protein